jgi:Mannosylglycerate hydrolase MGH1-like glycoside hydrolase domain
MRRFVFPLVLFMTYAACAAAQQEELPVGPGGRLFGNPNVEGLLARPYLDHVPMACVGERLWAAHPGGWGFPSGTVHYYLLTRNGVGFDLSISAADREADVHNATCCPSHVDMTGSAGPVEISGAKWITHNDVLVTELELHNTSSQPVPVGFKLALPADGVTFTADRFAWSRELHGLDVGMRGMVRGFILQPPPPPAATNVFQVEGEAPVSQSGSTGPDRKTAASGGQVLGSNFGGQEGHRAEWAIEVAAPVTNAVLTIRYARAKPGDAEWKLTLPNGTVTRHGFLQTPGWGDNEAHFALATFELGDLAAGTHTVQAVAVANDANVNFDALYIHPAGAKLPGISHAATMAVGSLLLQPGDIKAVSVFMAAGTRDEHVRASLQRVSTLDVPLQDQIERYTTWLVDNVPAFRSNEAMTKQYWHRATSVVRKNLFRVGEGRLDKWALAEGRWASGWYPNVISYGAGHQVREARWLRDPVYVRDFLDTWCENEKDNGVFPNYIRPNNIGGGQYTDWITSTAWDAHCVAPDKDALRRWADALNRNVDGWLTTCDTDDDGLLLVDSHWWTGMEWQPSFFYFNDFDKDQQRQHLERVDLTAYVYGSAKNLSLILDTIGDSQGAAHYAGIAQKIRGAVEKVMWDDKSGFFYSVEPDTHDKAMVKEIVGVYPFYFGMFDDAPQYAAAWKPVINPNELWTTWPVASCTKQCPAYSQDVTFNGKEIGGCMWNGPTWPHANSIVLSAMAATMRTFDSSPLTLTHFAKLLGTFTEAQFYAEDYTFPWTGEYYNGDTGEWRTGERDYNHSTYIDIIIADMAGLRPRPDDVLELHPLIASWTPSFLLDGVRYHGHDITIAWQNRDDGASEHDTLTGYRVYVNGRLVHHDEADMPGRVELAEYGLGETS